MSDDKAYLNLPVLDIINDIDNNYSPKWRWLVVEIYRGRVRGEVKSHH